VTDTSSHPGRARDRAGLLRRARRRRPGRGSLAETDPYWPAQLAVLGAIALHVSLPASLILGPRWVLPGLEGALLLGLVVTTPHRSKGESRRTRAAAILLVALVTATNLVSLGFLVHLLVTGARASGQQLILSAIQIWLTNVIIFGLWFWELDGGGPGRRTGRRDPTRTPDFLFPQMSSHYGRGWKPGFTDYLYVSFTNAAAFSPTDAMPLTRRAKGLMLVEALGSLVTVALVAGRAVNILG
jgi:uncharacterized membrane protein